MKTRVAKAYRMLIPVLGLAALAGCTSTRMMAVKQDFTFSLAPETKAPTKVAVLVDSSTRLYQLEKRRSALGSTTIYKVAVGQALSKAATDAFQTSFPEVRAISALGEANAMSERVVQLRFGPRTTAKLGKSTVSAQQATVELLVTVFDAGGKSVWETSVVETREGRKAGKAAAGALLGGLLGAGMSQSAYDGALEIAVREALQAVLETAVVKLQDQLSAIGL